ncbi:MAG TPA: hypothetical protein VGC42_07175 [Kofleriaceae bacterium]
MRPTKKPLALRRETVRQLSEPQLAAAQGAMQANPTGVICSSACPTLNQPHSCFDSCYGTQCCLEKP